jgi:hypothetical protein
MLTTFIISRPVVRQSIMSCLPHGNQEAETDTQEGTRTRIAHKDMHPEAYFLQLGLTS